MMIDRITLTTENDEIIECEIVAQLTVDRKQYIALNPLNTSVIDVYRYHVLLGDEIEISQIESDEELQMVVSELDLILNDV